jgi:general secretion pathway protein A
VERYLGEYGLSMDPFNHESPDPRMFHLTDSAAAALSNIITNIEARASLSILLADFGLGKTTFARMLWEHWSGRPGYRLAILDSTSFSTPRSLLDAMSRELRIGRSARSLGDYLETVKTWLFAEVVARADRCVIVIDEAQFLRVAQMNMLRNIINFALPGDAAPVQFLLVGTDRLITTLNRSPALYKRKSCLVTMQPFNRRETEEMLLHRLRQAGYRGAGLFSSAAIDLIHELSGGIPREITKLANWSLRKGQANGAALVGEREVREAQVALGEDLPSWDGAGAPDSVLAMPSRRVKEAAHVR